MYASEKGNIDIVKLLLQAGADKNIQNKVRYIFIYIYAVVYLFIVVYIFMMCYYVFIER